MEEVKKRIEWVDIGKFICIMFVMLSHLDSGSDMLDKFYRPFFLTVFFFLSGYVYRQPETFSEHIKNKVRGLFIPWLIFSHLNILLSMIFSFKGNRNLSEFIWNWLQIRGKGDGIWFVAALFVAYIPFYFIIKQNKPIKTCVVAFCLSLASVIYTHIMPAEYLPWNSTALPWHLEYIFQAMLWMVLGYYFKQYGENLFDKLNTVRNRILIWLIYIVMAYIPNISGGGIALSYIRSVLGITAIIAVCKVIKNNKYISFVGSNTLTYFALHGKIYTIIQKILEKVVGGLYQMCLNNPWTSSILAVVITFITSLVLIIPAVIINRYFPWILGRKRRSLIKQSYKQC